MKKKLVKALVSTMALSGALLFSNGVVAQPTHASAAVVSAPISVYKVTASVLNVRSAPNTSSKVVDTLRKNDQIEIVKFYNASWAQIKTTTTKNGIAYVSTNYLQKIPTIVQAKANLNLRTGPSTKNKVLTVIPKGAKVSFLGYQTTGKTQIDYNWAIVSYNGKKGFASTKYLNMK
ncbi:cell wall-binding protein [Bacillus sp. AFS002410]|uniref:SH3 domain-containing protein n=1 Tax=Bacillus sp. AFS002410 TaxID=2033481 RepID=UPI000BF1260B|nr:SH3 domain-containing protein [Bacillus sp. AFS002410]PEJ60612.1 cell wall-binding protein [Bacillus sp. AFS002410]